MKTNSVLIKEEKYANGNDAYKGSVLSTYGATMEITATAQINVSNAGKIVCPTDDKLQTARKKLRRGQIGARKQVEVQLGGTQLIKDVVAEVNSLDTAADIASLPTNDDLIEKLNHILVYDYDGQQFPLKEVLESRRKASQPNQLVRRRIEQLKTQYGYIKGSKMNNDLLEAIAREMKNYYSITGVDMVVSIKCKHVINTKGNYVACGDVNVLKTLIEEADYPQQGNRLVAGRATQQLVIPIQKVEQIKQIQDFISELVSEAVADCNHCEVITEGCDPTVDFAALKKADSSIKGW